MNEKEKFNLNFSVLWEWKNNFSSEELNNFNKWLYFKSHWNWRKMRFILNEKLENNWKNNILKVNLDEINFENKFYDFFEDIYNLFEEDLYDLNNQSILYDFLIWKKDSEKWILIKFIEDDFYKNYLWNLEKNLTKIFWKYKKWKNNFVKNNIKVILDNLRNNIWNDKDWENNNKNLFKNIWFFISSIIKIS
jgi:hypothetical protein